MEDGYEQTLPEDDRQLFGSVLEPATRMVAPDRRHRVNPPSPIKLYRCSEQSGKYKVAELKSGPILRGDLTSDSVYLVDRGEAGVWAWVGHDVNARERLEAVRNARGFVKKKNYSDGMPVARAAEGTERHTLSPSIRGESNDPMAWPFVFLNGMQEKPPRLRFPRFHFVKMTIALSRVKTEHAKRVDWISKLG